jgi:hypothetical protein
LGRKVNIGQLCGDVKCKQTASYFDDIKHAGIKVADWGGKLQNRNGKTTRRSNSTHCITVYALFTVVGFYFHTNFMHGRKGPVGTDEFLRLSLGRVGRHKFLQKQVELQIHKQWKFSNKPRSCAANLFKSGSTKEMAWDGHCDSELLNHTLVVMQFKWRFKLKHKATGKCFVGNLQICVLWMSVSECGHRYAVVWCSSYIYLQCTKSKCPEAEKSYTESSTRRRNSNEGEETNICLYLTKVHSAVQFCTYTTVRKHAVSVPPSSIEDVNPSWMLVYQGPALPQLN